MDPSPAVVPRRTRPLEPAGFVVWSSRATGSTSSTGAARRRRAARASLLIHGLVETAWAGRRSRAGCAATHVRRRRDGSARPRPLGRPDRGRRLRPADPRPTTWSPSPRAPGCSATDGRIVAGRSRVRGDRRGASRGLDARRSLCRARPRRRRLGVARGGDRHGCRRVPARPRRAAGGHALDGGVPRRPARVRPRDLGRRPGAGGTGDGRRDTRRPRRPGHATARAGGQRARDVRLRPARRPCRRRGAGHGRSSRPTTRRGRARRALAAASAAREVVGRSPIRAISFGHDGHNLMRYRPDEVSGRDPVGADRPPTEEARCRSSIRRAISPTTSTPRRSWAWPSRRTRWPSAPRGSGRRSRRTAGSRSSTDRARRGADHGRPRRAPVRFLEVGLVGGPRARRSRGRSCPRTRTRTGRCSRA